MFIPAAYVSGDELERALALKVGYLAVSAHPNEIGVLEVNAVLTLDLNHVLFDDHEALTAAATEHAGRGGVVGMHAYSDSPKLVGLASLPNVFVAKNHAHLLAKLSRLTRIPGRVRRLLRKAARDLNSEVMHVRENVNH